MHLVVHAAIGSAPISYEAENGGDTIATLSPKPGDEAKQESTSSDVLLELHGENQAHAFPPDVLVLSNLQEDGRVSCGYDYRLKPPGYASNWPQKKSNSAVVRSLL